MKKARFKDKHLDKMYQHLKDNTPKQLEERGIFGFLAEEFRRGFRGEPKAVYTAMNSVAYAAYVAGKESNKRKKR